MDKCDTSETYSQKRDQMKKLDARIRKVENYKNFVPPEAMLSDAEKGEICDVTETYSYLKTESQQTKIQLDLLFAKMQQIVEQLNSKHQNAKIEGQTLETIRHLLSTDIDDLLEQLSQIPETKIHCAESKLSKEKDKSQLYETTFSTQKARAD